MHCNIRALQVFECIYRHSSIAKAAEELAITRSAISHQLRYLRMQIGEELIEKTGRNLTFTPRGIKLAKSLSFAFSQIENSIQSSICEANPTLRVAMCSSFGPGWLIPRLERYAQRTECRLQISLQGYQPELSDAVADVFFTTTPIKDGFWSTKLFAENLIAVGTAAQVARSREQSPILITTDVEDRTFLDDWRNYLGLLQRQDLLDRAAVLGASHYLFALEMATHGLGLALVPRFLAEARLAAKDLQLWHDLPMPSGRTYYLNVKHARRNEPDIRNFTNWVRRMVVEGQDERPEFSKSA
ncbi:LysR family transcriptional regulator [Shinella sp. G-2]|uniref:LysR family transcriptional regulator n=1 Tax=Shinella sp. G-2 TaxID=3133141 RepID=UPI003CFEB7D4